jgi:hypothetical protein
MFVYILQLAPLKETYHDNYEHGRLFIGLRPWEITKGSALLVGGG